MTNASGSSRLWGLTKMIGGAALVLFAGRAMRKPTRREKKAIQPHQEQLARRWDDSQKCFIGY